MYDSAIDEEKGTFICFDKSRVISLLKLNDNYRDCDDGSDEPETPEGKLSDFYCANDGYIPNYIPRWSINDGICDCCDGSDEIHNPRANCSNICSNLESQRKKMIKEFTDSYQEGINQLKKLKREGSKELSSFKKQKRKIKSEISSTKNRIKQLEAMKKRLSSKPTPTPTPNPSNETTENQNDSTSNQNNSTSIIKDIIIRVWRLTFFVSIEDDPTQEIESDNLDNELSSLKSKLSELESKERNIKDKDKAFSSKVPLQYLSLYDQEFTCEGSKLRFMNNIQQGSTDIGRFKDYENETLFFEDGQYCWQTRSGRKTEMHLMCWKESKLVKAVEEETCKYNALFISPLVCSEKDIKKLENMDVKQLSQLRDQLGL
ncbi:glucosidase 2 subunit beta-like [Histomonas meleagridis]|uniref:glucosidase 2 subunit beta-like n=1 Tax=Histomonas meleagridis TaxID=135588 RepID=UPI0035595FD4|nr:glucosidase 2 subunit beta-like [Histomonas meleagridis]KAH0801196.1 glucosidase 2 subunit beta-like [Histomonas meleagridis]